MTDMPPQRTTVETSARPRAAREVYYDVDATNVVTPVDRVRWASVLAGVFTVFATLAVLAVLGIALGLSTFDADNPRNFGIGAGIYGLVSALIAFLLGG